MMVVAVMVVTVQCSGVGGGCSVSGDASFASIGHGS